MRGVFPRFQTGSKLDGYGRSWHQGSYEWLRPKWSGGRSCRQRTAGTNRAQKPCPRHARHRSCRRPRLAPGRTHRLARQAGGTLRRKVPHYRFRAVQLRQLRHTAHRRLHAIQGAEPDPAPATRLELPRRPLRRVRRTAAGAAARHRRLVSRHRRRGVPEHGYSAPAQEKIRTDPRRRSCLQNGLHAHARRPRGQPGRHDRRLRRSTARRGEPVRRDERGRELARQRIRRKAGAGCADAGKLRQGARQHGRVRIRRGVPV